MLALLVTLQAALGIVTLLLVVPLPLAIAHQVLAVVVFTFAIMHAERLRHRVDSRGGDETIGGGVRDRDRYQVE